MWAWGLGFYRDNIFRGYIGIMEKEHGNHYFGFRVEGLGFVHVGLWHILGP